jgi:hypothetical protein
VIGELLEAFAAIADWSYRFVHARGNEKLI